MQAQAKSTAWPPRSMCYMPGRGDKSVATDATTVRDIASEAFAALDRGGQQIPSFSARYPSFTLDDAYRVTALANGMRVSQGYKPLGRKAGFTNRQMWKEYGVGAPNWGYVYDQTMHDLGAPLPVAPYSEPKIEPEIMFGLAAPPSPGMDDAALLSCIAWVAHGFEIVQSIFPGWKFFLARLHRRQCHARRAADRATPRDRRAGGRMAAHASAIRSRALLRWKADGPRPRL
jgi:2-keto-4-pentenoate hydratase